MIAGFGNQVMTIPVGGYGLAAAKPGDERRDDDVR